MKNLHLLKLELTKPNLYKISGVSIGWENKRSLLQNNIMSIAPKAYQNNSLLINVAFFGRIKKRSQQKTLPIQKNITSLYLIQETMLMIFLIQV